MDSKSRYMVQNNELMIGGLTKADDNLMVTCEVQEENGDPKKVSITYRVTGCRFVQVADSYTWSFQAYISFTMSIKKKLITRAIKQATVSTIFSARARVACRF